MVVHAYYPLAEPRVQREAQAASNAGYEVTVVALRGTGESAADVVDGVRVRRLPLRHRRGASLPMLALEYLWFTVLATVEVARLGRERRLDVVQVHAPPDFLVVSALPARRRGARVLLDVHDLSPHMFGARFGSGGVVTRLLTLGQRAAAAVADAVVTVHEPYRRELAAGGIPASKIHVVMNTPDRQVLAAAGPRTAPAEGFRIAYHGTLTHWYGVDLLVDALARLEGVQALVIGDGDALPGLRKLAAERGVGDLISFSGRYVPIEEALAEVALCDCGVVPNRSSTLNRFALSSKLFEYVALGLPVVAARLETIAAHFGEGEVTFFEPNDAGSLAHAIRWVAEHPDEASTRAERAERRASAYAWSGQRERYLAVLADRPAPGQIAVTGRIETVRGSP
jgi:glycosyltransferase involved in cell wall biosynthesis